MVFESLGITENELVAVITATGAILAALATPLAIWVTRKLNRTMKAAEIAAHEVLPNSGKSFRDKFNVVAEIVEADHARLEQMEADLQDDREQAADTRARIDTHIKASDIIIRGLKRSEKRSIENDREDQADS